MKQYINIIVWTVLLSVLFYVQKNYANSDTITLNVPYDFSFKTSGDWVRLENILTKTNYKTYVLNWQGKGGGVVYAKKFSNAVNIARSQGKIIIFNIIGWSASMHAVSVCYGNKIIYGKNAVLMFHVSGKEWFGTYYRFAYNQDAQNDFNQCIRAGILNKSQVNKIWSGNQVYVTKNNSWYKVDTRPIY